LLSSATAKLLDWLRCDTFLVHATTI